MPPRGNAADGEERSRVLVFSLVRFCDGRSLDSGMELVMGAFALLPRNMGATRFFPSFVIVTFCCNICTVGSVRNQQSKVKGGVILGLDTVFSGEGGLGIFAGVDVSCIGLGAAPMSAAIIFAGASASFSFDFISNSSCAGLSGNKMPCRSCPYLTRNWTFSSRGRGFPKSPSSKMQTVIDPSYDEMNKLIPSGDQQRSEILFSAISCVMTSGRGFSVFQILKTLS